MAKNEVKRDLFRGAMELMILQSLRLRPMHGYGLVKHIQQMSENMLEIEEGSLYPALQRLLREGMLESEAGISAKGRPTRIYRLTRSFPASNGCLPGSRGCWGRREEDRDQGPGIRDQGR